MGAIFLLALPIFAAANSEAIQSVVTQAHIQELTTDDHSGDDVSAYGDDDETSDLTDLYADPEPEQADDGASISTTLTADEHEMTLGDDIETELPPLSVTSTQLAEGVTPGGDIAARGGLTFDPATTRFVQATAGWFHVTAVQANGTLWQWGQLSDSVGGSAFWTPQPIPTPVPLPTGVTAFQSVYDGGDFTVARDQLGRLWSWGSNSQGQLGIGSNVNLYATPQLIDFPAGVTSWDSVYTHGQHAVALDQLGNLWAWGWNANGQLGLGHTSPQRSPAMVPFPAGVTSWDTIIPSQGRGHFTLAKDQLGRLWGWGTNNSGQLGIGNNTNQPSPVLLPLPAGVTSWDSVFGGWSHALAIDQLGRLWAVGQNTGGQLGIGNVSNQSNYVLVPFPAGVTSWDAIIPAGEFTLAFDQSGRLWAWGSNSHGQLGDGTNTNRPNPQLVPLPAEVTSWGIAIPGFQSTYAFDPVGTLWAWGRNLEGQLGIGMTTVASVPDDITLPPGFNNTANQRLPIPVMWAARGIPFTEWLQTGVNANPNTPIDIMNHPGPRELEHAIDVPVTSDVVIISSSGAAEGTIGIEGTGDWRHFEVNGILTLGQTGNSNLTLQGHNPTGGDTIGGGIYVDAGAELTVIDTSIIGNAAVSGGGIYTALIGAAGYTSPLNMLQTPAPYSNLTLTNAHFENNSAETSEVPPISAATDLLNITFNATSIFWHPLNNYDINFIAPREAPPTGLNAGSASTLPLAVAILGFTALLATRNAKSKPKKQPK